MYVGCKNISESTSTANVVLTSAARYKFNSHPAMLTNILLSLKTLLNNNSTIHSFHLTAATKHEPEGLLHTTRPLFWPCQQKIQVSSSTRQQSIVKYNSSKGVQATFLTKVLGIFCWINAQTCCLSSGQLLSWNTNSILMMSSNMLVQSISRPHCLVTQVAQVLVSWLLANEEICLHFFQFGDFSCFKDYKDWGLRTEDWGLRT